MDEQHLRAADLYLLTVHNEPRGVGAAGTARYVGLTSRKSDILRV